MSKAARVPRLLQVGTDFSGLDSACVALKRLGIPTKLLFCSDSNPACEAFLKAKHKPLKFFKDVEQRLPQQEDYCDIYVTTPPCQSFSSAGKRQGLKDKRGMLLKKSAQYVKRNRPRLVILENVKGLTAKKFRPILAGLHTTFKRLGYRVHMRVLNAADFQVPQRRRRLFLVAIRKDSLRQQFAWPKPTGKRCLESVLDPWKATDCKGRLPKLRRSKQMAKKACSKIYAKGVNPLETVCAVDVGCSAKFLSFGVNVTPTLLRSRAASGGFWLSTRGRNMTLTELVKISGFQPCELIGYSACGIRHSQLAEMLGNCVPVPLIGEVLLSGMFAAGLVSSRRTFPVL